MVCRWVILSVSQVIIGALARRRQAQNPEVTHQLPAGTQGLADPYEWVMT